MSSEFPFFAWQREHGKRWITFTWVECCMITKAASKSQKTFTLPSNDPKKKLIINFEKMIVKNVKSGYEQRVRCLICNRTYWSWSWKNDNGELISYTPRVAYYLEVAYMKKLEKVDVFLKDEFVVNLTEFTQCDKETNCTRPIYREEDDTVNSYIMNTGPIDIKKVTLVCASDLLLQRKAAESENSLKSILFNLPSPVPDSGPVELPSSHKKIISALNAEVQASSSTSSTSAISDLSVPVDPVCPEAPKCEVYIESGVTYNATLNFTNLQDNNNKYFIIQLLKYSNKKSYALWLHWGRVGYKGQNNLVTFKSNLTGAKAAFEKKFYDKTHNLWSEKDNFKRVPTKYDLVHTNLSLEVSMLDVTAESKLDKRIQELLQIICNKKNLEDAAKEMLFDSKSTPLGKITAKQILEGYKALNRISELVKNHIIGKQLVEACNDFYTKIPHDFGRKSPPLITTFDGVDDKMKMLESLSNICLAMDLMDSSEGSENPIDKYYKNLECSIVPLDHTSKEFKALEKYMRSTHGPTHDAYTMDLIDAFQCEKASQNANFHDFGSKFLLWHGSRISNWLGILKKGLRIAPPEAPSTGFMFGKGLYFADVSSKSANYCFPTKKQNEGLLLLSEVSLGTTIDAHHATDFTDLPSEFKSVRGIGKFQPGRFEKSVLSKEAAIGRGPLVANDVDELSLIYNEYVIYNVHQVKMKYLLRIRFNF